MNYNNINFEAAFGTAGQIFESSVPEICFSGRSNVGKSSLINAVVRRKSLARTSSQPGKTATINFYSAGNHRLVDLPGYGYAKVPFSERDRWSELMEGYFAQERNIKLVFQLVDMRRPATEDDIAMMEFMKYHNIPFVVVLTKSDKLNKTEQSARVAAAPKELEKYCTSENIIPFSIKDSAAADKIRNIIEGLL